MPEQRALPHPQARRLPWLANAVDSASRPAIVAAASVLLVAIGLADVATGPELASSVFYMFPVGIVAWRCGPRWATTFALVAGAIWLAADIAAGATYSQEGIQFWNAGVRTSIFLILAATVSKLHSALEHERELARTDGLTGVANSRSFYEIAQVELARTRRNGLPLSVAYLDCDDFKRINDTYGHRTGDEALCRVASALRASVRLTDTVARMGGDEFVLLYPETGAQGAQVAIEKLRRMLALENGSPESETSCSIGVVTWLKPPADTDELLAAADAVMFEAKKMGKGSSLFRSLPHEMTSGRPSLESLPLAPE